MWSNSLSVKSRSALKYAQPLIKCRSNHSDEDSSSGSGGGDGYSSIHFGEPSSDKEEVLPLERKETCKMISI